MPQLSLQPATTICTLSAAKNASTGTLVAGNEIWAKSTAWENKEIFGLLTWCKVEEVWQEEFPLQMVICCSNGKARDKTDRRSLLFIGTAMLIHFGFVLCWHFIEDVQLEILHKCVFKCDTNTWKCPHIIVTVSLWISNERENISVVCIQYLCMTVTRRELSYLYVLWCQCSIWSVTVLFIDSEQNANISLLLLGSRKTSQICSVLLWDMRIVLMFLCVILSPANLLYCSNFVVVIKSFQQLGCLVRSQSKGVWCDLCVFVFFCSWYQFFSLHPCSAHCSAEWERR